jgi:hypothetical protein
MAINIQGKVSMTGRVGMGPGISTDPFWSNVVSLLKFNDTPGSTTFVDSATGATNWGRSGNATTTTALSKFGGISGYCDGAGDRFWSPTSAARFNLGTDDFTMEGWVAPINGGGGAPYGRLVQFGQHNVNGAFVWTRTNTPDPLRTFAQFYANGYQNVVSPTPETLPNGVFSFIALTRESGVWRLFYDGIKIQEQTSTGRNINTSYMMYGADNTSGQAFRGYFDEWRITKGVCRYTDNFPVPTSPFPTQ